MDRSLEVSLTRKEDVAVLSVLDISFLSLDNKLPQTWCIKQHTFIVSVSVSQGTSYLAPLLEVSPACSEGVSWAVLPSGVWGPPPGSCGCWQNSVLSSCRAEALGS